MDNAIYKLAYDILDTGGLRVRDFGSEVEFLTTKEFNADFIKNHDIHAILAHTNDQCKTYNDLYRFANYGVSRNTSPLKGEKLMCLRNTANYNTDSAIYNGMRYVLTDDSSVPNGTLCLPFGFGRFNTSLTKFNKDLPYDRQQDTYQFDYGYAMTVHKSQGSEYDNIAFIVPKKMKNDYINFLYTAVTRAKKKLYVVLP